MMTDEKYPTKSLCYFEGRAETQRLKGGKFAVTALHALSTGLAGQLGTVTVTAVFRYRDFNSFAPIGL